MPVLLRQHGYEFWFRSSDGGEPPHVHVEGNRGIAKLWLTPTVRIAKRRGYSKRRLEEISRIATQHRETWLDAWTLFFGR